MCPSACPVLPFFPPSLHPSILCSTPPHGTGWQGEGQRQGQPPEQPVNSVMSHNMKESLELECGTSEKQTVREGENLKRKGRSVKPVNVERTGAWKEPHVFAPAPVASFFSLPPPPPPSLYSFCFFSNLTFHWNFLPCLVLLPSPPADRWQKPPKSHVIFHFPTATLLRIKAI